VTCKKAPPGAKLIVVDNPEEAINDIRDMNSQVDLPNTGNFGGYSNELADESGGGETVVDVDKNQSPDLWQTTPLIPLRGRSRTALTHCIVHLKKRTE
jgi:hypothetical protein